jgi:hypothetical protein
MCNAAVPRLALPARFLYGFVLRFPPGIEIEHPDNGSP